MLDNQNLSGKKVLVRVDFNVPLDNQLHVTDDTRIRGALPTITELLERGAKVILMSHLGRPLKDLDENGKIKFKYSLKNIVPAIEQLTHHKIEFRTTPLDGEEPFRINDDPNTITLLENTRFYKGEEKGDTKLAEKMSTLAEYYINDAFGAAHREHASTATIARFFDSTHKSFGHLMDKEVSNISKMMDHPARPFCAIVGGAKVSDKIALLDNLLNQVDIILIGGGMAFTFIKGNGGSIGNSLCELDKTDMAIELLKRAKEKGVEIILPIDVRIAETFSNDAASDIVNSDNIPDGWSGLDIGPKTIQLFDSYIQRAKTILWNGPAGVFEFPNFAHGTFAMAQSVAKATSTGAFSIIGGGDSVAAINQAGLEDRVSFVSTGGGAMLEMIEGKVLPGIAAMKCEI